MSRPDDTQEDIDNLAGEYVLGTLPAEQRKQVQAQLPENIPLRDAVARWEERLLPLNTLAQPVTPSASLWRRISATLQPQAKPSALPSLSRSWRLWGSLTFWRSLSAAGLTCAVLLSSTLLMRPTSVEYVVVLVEPGSNAPGWMIQAVSDDIVELIPLAGTKVPEGQALEFWTKADAWAAPASLGLVQPGKNLRVHLADLPPLEANQLFELTLEPASGSPTGKPTGPIQAIGRAVRL